MEHKVWEEEFSYTVLVYVDSYGVWMKIPEFDIQCLTEDWEAGLDVLGEHLAFQLDERRRKGECVPERLIRTVRHVDKGEFGPTQVEIEEWR